MKTRMISLCMILLCTTINAQIGSQIPSSRIVDWTQAGYQGSIPEDSDYIEVFNVVTDFGADNSGVSDVSINVANAIAASNQSVLTMIFFPPGTYKFNENVTIDKSNLVLKGSGQYHTILRFNKNSGFNISAHGTEATSSYPVSSGATKGSNSIVLSSTSGLTPNDYVIVEQDMFSFTEWNAGGCVPAYLDCKNSGTPPDEVSCKEACDADPNCNGQYAFNRNHRIGQIVQISSSTSTTLSLIEELSFDYDPTKNIRITKINPIEQVGIENMKIVEENMVGSHSVDFDYAVNCWIKGVESEFSSYAHFNFNFCSHIEISNCYIHDTYRYDVAYGIYFGQYFTSFCKAENNIIDYVRHSIILSSSAVNNVIGYNYANRSRLAITGSPQTPGNKTSDLLIHGYWPTANLFEGNVMGVLHSDEYHGWQGKYNTFIRNKFIDDTTFHMWGTTTANAHGNVGVINWDIVGNCPDLGSTDFLSNCNYPYYNCSTYPDYSYYQTNKPSFLPSNYSWPAIGTPVNAGASISNSNYAHGRFETGGHECGYKRSNLVGYSVENDGLVSAFNQVNNVSGVLYKNEDRLSIGVTGLYQENQSNKTIDEVTTARLYSTGQEEIIFAINASNGAYIYKTTGENNVITNIFYESGATITALTSGDFNGDYKDEIVIAYLDNSNRPYVWRSNDINNLKQTLIYSKTYAYWSIDALTTGDFDNDGDDELILGFNSSGNSAIYHSTDANSIGIKTWENTNNYWDVDALAAGDFDEDGKDELIQGFNSSGGPAIYKVKNGLFDSPVNIYTGSNYWSLAALAAGDFDADDDDELISGFNSANEGPSLYKSEKAINASAVRIYDKDDVYWNLSALAIEKCNGTYSGNTCYHPGEVLPPPRRRDHISTNENLTKIYPNPSNGIFAIELGEFIDQEMTINILSISGKVLRTFTENERFFSINLSDLPKGVYFINISSKNKNETQRIVLL